MNLKTKLPAVIAALLFSIISFAQTNKAMTEYLGVPGPIPFDKGSYNLSWTSHPSGNYYKQEYLTAGQTSEKFKNMLMLEVLTGKNNVQDIVSAKVAELKQMKETNPMVNYEMFEKNGEIIIDFLLSANTADGKHVAIVERNVYRYKSVVDKSGQTCILLFAVSERSYGNDIDKFLVALKSNKTNLTKAVATFKMPEISISK